MMKGLHGQIYFGNNVYYTFSIQYTMQLAFQKQTYKHKETHPLFKKKSHSFFSYLHDSRTLTLEVHLLTPSTDSLEEKIILKNLYCI